MNLIFFGNGPLADTTLSVLQTSHTILFHAKTRADLSVIQTIKLAHPDAIGILASFGALIPPRLLTIFEPIGILNLHPSLLPLYRGASPIETALLHGDTTFGVSIIKLTDRLDAGPIYYQTTQKISSLVPSFNPLVADPNTKPTLYHKLATLGTAWLNKHLRALPTPTPQAETNATYAKKLNTSLSPLNPAHHSTIELLNQIRAFANFPKSRFTFFGRDCIILSAHIEPNKNRTKTEQNQISSLKNSIKTEQKPNKTTPLTIYCADQNYLIIDRLQPAGGRPMTAEAFLNGYAR